MSYFDHHYISNSDLKKVRKMVDPKFDDPADLEEILKFGTLVHALIFEPHKADPNHKDYGLAVDMSKTFFNDPMCRDFIHLHDFEREKEFYNPPEGYNKAEDEEVGVDGVYARCKMDGSSFGLKTVMEFKGLSCESEKSFEAAMDRFDYDMGLAWYLDVSGYQRCLMVGVSKKSPKRIFKRIADRNHPYYRSGRKKIVQHIEILKELVGDGVWQE